MSTIYCENCGAENLDSVKFCKQCGTKLAAAQAQSVGAVGQTSGERPAATAGSIAPTKIENRYTALRGIASLCRLLSWIFVGLAVLGALGGLIVMFNSFLSGLGAIVGAVIWGAVTYIFWQIVAESISVLLDIEANTRRTTALLEQRFN